MEKWDFLDCKLEEEDKGWGWGRRAQWEFFHTQIHELSQIHEWGVGHTKHLYEGIFWKWKRTRGQEEHRDNFPFFQIFLHYVFSTSFQTHRNPLKTCYCSSWIVCDYCSWFMNNVSSYFKYIKFSQFFNLIYNSVFKVLL